MRPPTHIAVALVGVLGTAILLAFGLSLGAWWVVGSPALGRRSDGLNTFLEALRIVLSVVAGLGGVVALVMLYRRQRFGELAERRAEMAEQRENTKLLHERFAQAVEQLGHENPSVRLGGVHGMAAVADDWDSREDRQMCIDVLCSYLRMPGVDEPSAEEEPAEHLAWRAFREVRHTILRIIAAHLRPGGSTTSWQGHNFDLRGIAVDLDLDLAGARFPEHSTLDLSDAKFTGGDVRFSGAQFTDGTVDFSDAQFTDGDVHFSDAQFTGGDVDFSGAQFTGSTVYFSDAQFSGGDVDFGDADFSGGNVDFSYAQFTSGTVNFDSAGFSGGNVDFDYAQFGPGFRFKGRAFVTAPRAIRNLPAGLLEVEEPDEQPRSEPREDA